jgi:hypothetical protein
MRKLDLKSALVGLGAGILLTLCVGAATRMPAGPVGRYQVTMSEARGLVIDTMTGQVWASLLSRNARSDEDFFKPKASGE